MVLKKEIIEQLSKDLPFTGVEQDWDIEMANANRIDEFISFYKKSDMPEDMRISAMALILASYDGFLNDKNLSSDDRWNTIKSELNYRRDILKSLIDYWSVDDETEDIFKITPLVRDI